MEEDCLQWSNEEETAEKSRKGKCIPFKSRNKMINKAAGYLKTCLFVYLLIPYNHNRNNKIKNMVINSFEVMISG